MEYDKICDDGIEELCCTAYVCIHCENVDNFIDVMKISSAIFAVLALDQDKRNLIQNLFFFL